MGYKDRASATATTSPEVSRNGSRRGTAPASANAGNGRNGGHGRADGSGSGRGYSGSGRPPGPSTRLALIVLVITGVLFLGGFLVEWLGSGSPSPTASSVRQAKTSPLVAVSGAHALSALIVAGQPPSDVIAASVVPEGTTAVAGSSVDSGVETYDRNVELSVNASQSDVIRFYRAELAAEGWGSVQQAAAPTGPSGFPSGSVEVLAKRGASDGYYWEIGVTVLPTRFASSTAPNGSSSAVSGSSSAGTQSGEVTDFRLRLFVVDDDEY